MKKTVYKEIEEAKTKHANQVKDLRDKLAAAEAEKTESEKLAADVLDNGSAEDYAKARAVGRDAEDRAEYYRIKLAEAEQQPLFEGEELKAKMAAIRENTDKLKAEKIRAATETVQAGYNTMCELLDDLNKANKAITDLEKNHGKKLQRIDVISVAAVCKAVGAVSNMTEAKPYWK